MNQHVEDVVREHLALVEKELQARHQEVKALVNQITELNMACVDMDNEIDECKRNLERLNKELNTARDQLGILGDAKRELGGHCLALQAKIDAFHEYMGTDKS
jgi:chromosome segregation ATPase